MFFSRDCRPSKWGDTALGASAAVEFVEISPAVPNKRHAALLCVKPFPIMLTCTAAPKGTRTREQGTAQGQRDPEAGHRVFRQEGARPPSELLKGFIDQHRPAYGVESICKVLQIALSDYWRHAACQRTPQLRCARAERDELVPHVARVWQDYMRVYGADKFWKQMNRERVSIARCTVERVMKCLGLQGVRRGKVVRTTIGDAKLPCPLDRVNRVFKTERPNQLWVSDFTYISTQQG